MPRGIARVFGTTARISRNVGAGYSVVASDLAANKVYWGGDRSNANKAETVSDPLETVLELPPRTDVRSEEQSGLASPDLVECPQGSGSVYAVHYVEDVYRGWPGEFRRCICRRSAVPINAPMP